MRGGGSGHGRKRSASEPYAGSSGFARNANGWRLALAAAEVKNREPYGAEVPAEVGAILDRYVAIYRPILLAASKARPAASATSRLWITQFGTPPTPEGFAQIICIETAKAFGKPIPPHFFRDCAMTSWALDLPKHVRGGKHLLGNRSFSVVQSAYNMAGSNDAAAKLQQTITTLRQDTGAHNPRQAYGRKRGR